MKRVVSLFAVVGFLATGLHAQESPKGQWITVEAQQAGQPAWLRREIRAFEPSTGAIRLAASAPFSLWVNGQKIGDGEKHRVDRFNLSGIVERGLNVIAIELNGGDAPSGVFVEGDIRSQSGKSIRFDSDDQWRGTTQAPTGDSWKQPRFDESAWAKVKVIGPHEQSPFAAQITFPPTGYLDRLEPAPGLAVERIAEPKLVGSLVQMTWGNRGRLIASRERGPILSVIDENGDGIFDKVVEFSDKVKNCQGLCVIGDILYAVGDGPDGTGIYRLTDADHDDKAESVELLLKHNGGMGEHGPHQIVLGPDGWLYHNLGNHAGIPNTPEENSPVRDLYEGDLLQPRFEDAHGHAAGIKIPGGTIWRFTPDGKQWWLETNGFRNEYDIAFNSNGDLFTFDSDMEWDVGLPWYRPVRINHCIPGAEFGWRSGAAKWPAYHFDSLPATVDVGRGSPTAVVFYEHELLEDRYRGSLLACDWSMGRILAIHLEPHGASYNGTSSILLAGNPLNVSGITVAPDGSVVYCTGGRGTEGGIYRIAPESAPRKVPPAETLEDILALPQFQTTWARELATAVQGKLGDAWGIGLEAAARDGSAPQRQIRALTIMNQLGPKPSRELLLALADAQSSEVRAMACWLLGDHPDDAVAAKLTERLADPDLTVRRRAAEAFVRGGLTPPVAPLLEQLASSDRFLRFAARTALERAPVESWKPQAMESTNPRVATHAMLALYRRGQLSPAEVIAKSNAFFAEPTLQNEDRLALIRLIQLTAIRSGVLEIAKELGPNLLAMFPTTDPAIDMELARLLAVLQLPGAADKLMTALEQAPSEALQVHYALTLHYLNEGWTFDHKRRLLDWYESTDQWEGGHSFGPYLENIVGASLARYSPEDRRDLIKQWRQRPFATQLLLRKSDTGQIADFDATLEALLTDWEAQPLAGHGERLIGGIIETLGKDNRPTAQRLLRQVANSQPDQRDAIARVLARTPHPDNFDFLIRAAAASDDPATLQPALKALSQIDQKPEGAYPYRAVLLAGQKLDAAQQPLAVDVLRKWTGTDQLDYYKQWYQAQFPQAPAAEIVRKSSTAPKYTYEQLLSYLDKEGASGDVANGKQIFAKANCVKCHRFNQEGEGIGPDLTTLRRRFQRKEILDALLYPSAVISDQYRSVTVVTTDGLVHTGLPAKQADSDKLVLWLPTAAKLEIPKSDIEEMAPSPTSVMPEGVLGELSLQEIADLFAFLETSKFNASPTDPATDSIGGR